MDDANTAGWRGAWRWYAAPAVILAAALVADLAGWLDALRP